MSRKKPLCAWCGKPLSGSTIQSEYLSIPSRPTAGWHLGHCRDTDPLVDGLSAADGLEDEEHDETTDLLLKRIESRGLGRVIRNKSSRRSPRVSLDKIHYAGALKYRKANGHTVSILGGWAACCSGDQATAIRNAGNHTYNPDEVTCGRCKIVMAKASQASTRTPRKTN